MAIQNITIEVDADTTEVQAGIDQLYQLFNSSELHVPECFLEALDRFISTGDFINQCFAIERHTAGAFKLLMVFKPTERFDMLIAAVRARNFDIDIFEV